MNHTLEQKVLHCKVTTGKIVHYNIFNCFLILYILLIYILNIHRGSADNITVVVINLKDRKYSISETKKNQ